jgi:hypothetical protein
VFSYDEVSVSNYKIPLPKKEFVKTFYFQISTFRFVNIIIIKQIIEKDRNIKLNKKFIKNLKFIKKFTNKMKE